jgi:(R)-2-hydroxyacyl-CoA dehydratese activating ATPase
MIVAGCDVGSLTAKAVIMREGEIISSHVIRVETRPEVSAESVMDKALSMAGLSMDDIEYSVGTGYGRKKILFVNDVMSEIVCHGMAVKWLMPSVQTIIDVGGQDAKAIRVDESGAVVRYAYNDKCASGTGRFLEIMAKALETRLEDLGEISMKSEKPIKISNQCTVFAETEVISQINNGKNIADIISGLHRAMAHRVASLANSIDVMKDVAMSGGVAKNIGMYSVLEDVLGLKFLKNDIADPQINGALGAALFAARAKDN